jgi:hypothetical protein
MSPAVCCSRRPVFDAFFHGCRLLLPSCVSLARTGFCADEPEGSWPKGGLAPSDLCFYVVKGKFPMKGLRLCLIAVVCMLASFCFSAWAVTLTPGQTVSGTISGAA